MTDPLYWRHRVDTLEAALADAKVDRDKWWRLALAADDVMDAVEALHHKVYSQASPMPYCHTCGDTHEWPCPTALVLQDFREYA